MRRRRLAIPILLCLLTVTLALAALTNSAAVVVHFPQGRVATRHVAFEADLNGLELLHRSGLRVESTPGGAVCRIDDVGCPATDCFCQCTGVGPCRFWAYWTWTETGWAMSLQGAATTMRSSGALDGWRWGEGPPTSTDGRSPSLIPAQHAAYSGVAWLRAQQRPDGGYPGFGVGGVLDVVLASAAADKLPDRAALDYIATQVVTYTQRGGAAALGKTLAAVVAAGGNPSSFGGLDLLSLTHAAYVDGRFGQSNWDQAWAILGLNAVGAPVPVTATRALTAASAVGGGWGFAPGFTADVDSTGLVLQALVAAGEPLTSTAILSAKTYLRNQQGTDGGFPVESGAPSNVPSTAMAVLGLVAIGDSPLAPSWTRNGQSPIDFLLTQRSPAGGFPGYAGPNDIQATAQAVPALLGKPYPERGGPTAAARALRWLNSPEHLDSLLTFGPGGAVDALLAAGAAGQAPHIWRTGRGESLLEYLAAQSMTYTASSAAATAKLIVGLHAVGASPSSFGGVDLPTRLADFATTSGRYGATPTEQAWATLALSVLGRPTTTAAAALRALQLPDGGWGWSVGQPADTNTTALAVQALAAAGEPLDSTAVLSATAYFRAQQNLDGGWPYAQPGDSDANSTANVILALTALRADPDGLGWTTRFTATTAITLTAHTPVDWLLAAQSPSGAFPFFGVDSAFATAQAIPALLDRSLPIVPPRRLFLPLLYHAAARR